MVELQKRNINYNFIFTGQHKDTMEQLSRNFGLKNPDFFMDKSSKDITGVIQMSVWVIKNLIITLLHKKEIFQGQKGIVMVHGDTFSTLLGALMGKLAGLKVAHVESGLRSFDFANPFPEEITRVIVFKFTDYYFCSGTWEINNLKKESGIKVNTYVNTLYDSLQLAIKPAKNIHVHLPDEKYAVVTIHRFENIFRQERLKEIIEILEKVARKIRLLFIMHKPTEQNLHKFDYYKILEKNKNIELRPRYDYFEFVKLMNNSEFLISDGGSNQEESSYLGKPCLLLRKATERLEGLNKNVVLSNYDMNTIIDFVENYRNFMYEPLIFENSPSKTIVDVIVRDNR
ncbi:MAG TPA: UDP-N-acetylglucosamine 2-epimerase [Candidatus Methylomirabilis sp.]|nr:UDP-N-acetylglucosamine 2-epimerase [Candidatus Methylomirabilis sp.]